MQYTVYLSDIYLICFYFNTFNRRSDIFSSTYTLNGILLSHKNNEILLFAATEMDLEIITLREASQKERDKCYVITYIWNLKNNTD